MELNNINEIKNNLLLKVSFNFNKIYINKIKKNKFNNKDFDALLIKLNEQLNNIYLIVIKYDINFFEDGKNYISFLELINFIKTRYE